MLSIVKRIWSKLTGGRLVWLRDFDGRVTLAIARIDPWGDLVAERWWPWRIQTVRLLTDGKVDGALYVEDWIDADAGR
jgi:hypothetical protein